MWLGLLCLAVLFFFLYVIAQLSSDIQDEEEDI
jgi:hypothetical protein